MSFLPLLLIWVTLFRNSNGQEPPKISISFPDVGDRDFVNETVAIMSNSNAAFLMECNASYPIEWIFHYSEEDDGTSEKLKLAETRRTTEHFSDPSTYKYTARLRVEYKGKLLVLSNFTCKGTLKHDPKLQTHVYMTDQNKKNILILEISNDDKGKGSDSGNLPRQIEENKNCVRAETTVAYNRTWRSPCWSCRETPDKMLELDFQPCQTPIECNSVHSRLKKGKQCLREVEEVKDCKLDGNIAFYPKIVLCKNFGAVLAQFYFFGVFRGNLDDEVTDGPPIYYEWKDVNPYDMLFVHPIKPQVYQGEKIDITCEYSRYYFSLGSWLGIKNSNGIQYIPGFDVKPCETSADFVNTNRLHHCNKSEDAHQLGTFTANFEIQFDIPGFHEIVCFGPVWNTTEWVNTSLSFNVDTGQRAEVLTVVPDKDDFVVGDVQRHLTCTFKGVPKPHVLWSGPENSRFTQIDEGLSSTIKFSEIGFQTSGNYVCTVSSFLGTHSKHYTLHSHAPDTSFSRATITGIVLSSLVVCILICVVIGRMGRIILQQQKALRILTEAEIQEFINGNPEFINRSENKYFDNALAIDALPYDLKYEIPAEKLSIDYSTLLGSGEFGVVLKGKILPENVSHYQSLSVINNENSGNNSTSEEMEVAVKVCKKDVDVNSFKALLSEVKVMAYLGQHENIVSLIAAFTQNIRNRELSIVIEYCHNGSMEKFLKKNRKSFLNKVKYGFYTPNSETGNTCNSYIAVDFLNESTGGYVNTLSDSDTTTYTFTSEDLFRWTCDIANGVEYIHSKKVIHGDLAVRNLLLTKNMTVKVGDFGLSRQLGEMTSYTKKTQCALPWRNMAIESLKQLDFSVKSDIWSFGVTLWEMYTLGDVPYPGVTYTVEFANMLEQGTLRLAKPPFATNDIYEFMLSCWEPTPEDRPTTTDIKLLCDKLLRTQ